MSYLFSQTKQNPDQGRAQVILIWMVLVEIIRIHGNRIVSWELQKSAEQLVRSVWVGFLVYSYKPLQGIRTTLFVLCIYFFICEVLKGILFNIAKDSFLIGKNPKLIQNYMKSIMLNDTIPLSSCEYIVMGEEYNDITFRDDGYHLGESRSDSVILKIDRVFAYPDFDSAFTSKFPSWRDNCLSLALAKMLRRRFANLPLHEAGSKKALDFVLKGLIDYIGDNQDIISRDGSSTSEINPKKRVFSIINEELKIVSEFLHIKVPLYYYHCKWYALSHGIGFFIVMCSWSFVINDVRKATDEWLALVAQDEYNDCFFHIFKRGSLVVWIFSGLDIAITLFLYVACAYIQFTGFVPVSVAKRWSLIYNVKMYIKDPNGWIYYSRPLSPIIRRAFSYNLPRLFAYRVTRARSLFSVFDIKTESILYSWIKVNVSILARFPKCIRRKIPVVNPDVYQISTNVEEAILISFRDSGGRLTNGVTSLRNNNMGNLNWACPPNGSTTQTILIWHIATTLFQYYHESRCRHNGTFQEPSEQNTNQKVALELSSYCCYLVAYLPELLPDEVKWTNYMYESVIKEMLSIDPPSDRATMKNHRCNYVLHTATWHEQSVVGKGVMLAKYLIKHVEDGGQVWSVWKMLADFWTELILFIAPSDNVKAHEEILERQELITQLWALLTHAGILTRPASNEVYGDENV